jgi:hypothetical protein
MGNIARVVEYTKFSKHKLMSALLVVGVLAVSGFAQPAGNGVLKPSDVEKVFPATVYYGGRTAPAQLRNSGGVKFADGHSVLVSLVDTSGYSTSLAAKYQGYLLTEVPLKISGQQLPAGAYGIGFLSGDVFLITDLGGADVLKAKSATDAAMARPRPLQVRSDPAGGFRLYAGRSYVQFNR